jgi:hypothetical protein
VAAINHILRDALNIPDSRYGFISPTYKQGKDTAWDILKNYARVVPGVQFNEQELRADFPNGSRVRIYGADNPDSLRGIALWGVVFDEYSQQPANIFGEIISKALADHYGYAIWIGTVKGKNHLYQTYKEGEKHPNEWFTVWQDIDKTLATEKGVTIDNLRMALADDLKLVEQGIMTEEEYQQEWFLSVTASVKGAVYAKEWLELTSSNRLIKIPYDKDLETYSAWDFGIGDATAIGIYQIARGISLEPRLIDYYENSNQNLDHYLSWLKSKPYKLTMSYGDPSGNNRQLNTGRSLFEDLNSAATTKFLGYPIRMFARRTKKIDQIHAVKQLLKILYVDERLDKFIEALKGYHYTWDDKRGEFSQDPFHDSSSHGCDSLAYFAVNYLYPHNKTVSPLEKKIRKQYTTSSGSLDNSFYSNQI